MSGRACRAHALRRALGPGGARTFLPCAPTPSFLRLRAASASASALSAASFSMSRMSTSTRRCSSSGERVLINQSKRKSQHLRTSSRSASQRP